MADKLQLLVKANERGLLKGRHKAMYDAAVERGLIKPTKPEAKGGLSAAFGASVDKAQELGYRAVEGLTDVVGEKPEPTKRDLNVLKPGAFDSWLADKLRPGGEVDQWAEKGIERNVEEQKAYEPTVKSYKDIGGIKDFGNYAGELVAGSLPYMAAAANPIGAATLAGGLSQEAYEKQPEDEKNVARAVASGSGQMLLERLGIKVSMGQLGKDILKDGVVETAKRMGKGELVQAVRDPSFAKRILKGAAGEGLTETGQEALAQWGAGKSIDEFEGLDEAFFAGLTVGGAMRTGSEAAQKVMGYQEKSAEKVKEGADQLVEAGASQEEAIETVRKQQYDAAIKQGFNEVEASAIVARTMKEKFGIDDPVFTAAAQQNQPGSQESEPAQTIPEDTETPVFKNDDIDYDAPTAARQAGFDQTARSAGQYGDMLTSPAQQSLRDLDAGNNSPTVDERVRAAAFDKSPTPEDRFSPIKYQHEGEILGPESVSAPGIENAPIDGRAMPERGKLPTTEQTRNREMREQAQADLESQPKGIEQKDIIFGEDGRPQQRAAEQVKQAGKDAENLLPHKDIVFAGNESGVNVAKNGEPFKTKRDALLSKEARAARRAGHKTKAVSFDSGYGWTIKGGDGTKKELEQPAGTQKTENVTQPEQQENTAPSLDADAAPAKNDEDKNIAVNDKVNGVDVISTPVSELSLSKDIPQFKSGSDVDGVVEPLTGKFDPVGMSPVQVWVRNNGEKEIITGRHRFDLAKRDGVENIPAQYHYESDGFTADDGKRLDAILNIREDKGQVEDYVELFKQDGITESEAKQYGLLDRATGRSAFKIANSATNETIEAQRTGRISAQAAEAIADAAPGNERLQVLGIKSVADDQRSITFAKNLIHAVSALDKNSEQESQSGDLFGFDDSAMQEAEQMAKVAAANQRDIRNRLSAIRGAANKPEIAKAEGINVKNPKALKKRTDELANEVKAWDSWHTNPEMVQQIRDSISAPKDEKSAPSTAPTLETNTDPENETQDNGPDLFGEAEPEIKSDATSGEASKEQSNASQKPAKQPPIESGLDAYDAMVDSINKGELNSAQEVKGVLDYLADNEESVKGELKKLNKKQLTRLVSGHVWSDTKKSELVDSAYRDMFTRFRFIGNASDFISTTSYKLEDKISEARKHVDALTDQQVAEYSKAQHEKVNKRTELLQKHLDKIKNPETLDDYKAKIKAQGKDSLTPEQQVQYDKLVAEETIANKNEKPTEKEGLKTDGDVELGEPVEAVHGKTGEKIFNVSVISRLGKEAFKEAANFARSMGGGYYKGNFYFKSIEDAELFSGWVNGETVDTADKQAEKQENRTKKNAEKLRAMAEKAEQRANESLNADRKTNTVKRLGEAEAANARAEKEIELSKIMRDIPGSDTIVLKNATQKVQVELLDSLARGLVNKAPDSQVDKDSNSRRTFKEEVSNAEKVKHAKMPLKTARVFRLKELANDMGNTKGFVLLGRKINTLIKGKGEQEYVDLVDSIIPKYMEYIDNHASQYDMLRDEVANYKRLERMGVTNEPTLRTALIEYMNLSADSSTGKAPSKLSKMERDLQRTMLGNRNAFNDFFPTPESLASDIAEMADIEPGMSVLEPSAGNGLLADAAKEKGANVDVVEMAGQLREILKEKGYSLVGDDFLEQPAKASYDRVIMNPPFSNDQDIAHVEHAYKMLKPGGKLVAITSSMAGDRSNKANKAFKEWLESLDAEQQALPANAFKSSLNSTGVNTKAIVLEKPASQPKPSATKASSKKAEKPQESINDFGEKLGGARKDAWSGFSDAILDQQNTAELPLSKSWPEPNYKELADKGVSAESIALMAAMRSEIPAKPRVARKVARWAKKVSDLKDFAGRIVTGERDLNDVMEKMRDHSPALASIVNAVPSIAKAEVEAVKSVADYRISSGSFSIFGGQKYSPSKTFYFIERNSRPIYEGASENLSDVQALLAKQVQKEQSKAGAEGGTKKSKISVYLDRHTKKAYLGWKGASGVLKIKEFENTSDARNYLNNNRSEVEQTLQKMKDTPRMRKPVNADRVGPERYAGNVTPEIFANEFGFRGVEFGNWVEQGKRQKDLNQAYDGLIDLAEALDIQPKALSLNGQLGLAFGARGKGGKEPAAAHYEPDTVVINLTKKSGAGSLAHEWWHALDHYFGKQKSRGEFITDMPYSLPTDQIRPEMAGAFKHVRNAVIQSGLPERSRELDTRRSKAYWATNTEMTARSFETYIIDKLSQQGVSNDYLANVVGEEAWAAAEALGMEDGNSYPYPNKAEQEQINPAYQSLFDTIESENTSEGIRLFSKSKAGKKSKGVSAEEAQTIANDFIKELNGANGITVRILETTAEAEKMWRMSLDGATVKGAYSEMSNTVYVIAENVDGVSDLRQTLAHETIAHGGLDTVIGKKAKQEFIDRIKKTKGRKAFQKYWSDANKDYWDMSDDVKAEEIFARFVENEPSKGELKYWWNALKRFIRKQLDKLGVVYREDTELTAMREMLESIVAGFKSQGAVRGSGQGTLSYNRSRVNMHFKDVTKRTPELQEAAKKVRTGEMTAAEYDKLVNTYKPVEAYTSIPEPATVEEMENALDSKKILKLIEPLKDIKEGENVGLRLDIPAYKHNGTWIVTVHEGKTTGRGGAAKTAIGYDSAAMVTNPNFEMPEKPALMIATGKEKGTIATIGGGWVKSSPDEIAKLAEEALNDPSWTQVGMDPERHGYFYDRTTMEPVVSGDLALQVGGLVMVKNPKYGNKGDYLFSRSSDSDTRTAKQKLGLEEQAAETFSDMAKEKANKVVDTLKTSPFWNRLNEGIFDGLSGIKNAELAAGVTDPNKQGYVSARLASGLADVLHGVFNYGAPQWRNGIVQRKEGTKGLLEVFGMVGDDLNSWLAWMGANRAEQLKAQGRENNLTDSDIAELKALANGKERLFEQTRLEYNKVNSAILDMAQQAGLLSKEQRAGFDEEYYVPFFRDMGETDPEMDDIKRMIVEPHTRKGIAGQSSQIKNLKGGMQSTKDLLENIIARQSTLIDASLKNKAMQEVVNNLDGTDYMKSETSEDIASLSQQDLNKLGKVKVMVDGKPQAYVVSDPALLRALIQVNDVGSQSLFNRLGRSAKRFLTAGITLSPDFIFKNFVRDAAHAWMINKDGFALGSDSIKGLKKAFKEDEAYRDLIFSGAAFQGGYIHGADPEAGAQQMRRALRAKGLTSKEVEGYMATIVTNGATLLEKYRGISDKFENANRLSTYEAAIANGKSKRQAAYEAKDLMDYSLKGNFKLIGTMIDTLPFFNARLQGMSKLVRAAKASNDDRVLRFLSANLAMKGAKVAAISMALAWINDDDEDYQELPDWDKDMNWHFFVDGEHMRIPKPFELGIIFGTLPERLFHYGSGTQTEKDLGKSVANAVWNTMAMNPIPQMFLPATEVLINKSFFKGSPIEGMADQNKQAEDRYSAYTSDTAKAIAQQFGVSPKKVEHLIKGYTGTIGGYVLGASDIVARQIMGKEAPDTPVSRYPVVKSFYQGSGPKTNTKFATDFYEAMDAARQAYGSYKRAMELGDTTRQKELIEKDGQKLRSRATLAKVQRMVSKLRKMQKAINDNDKLNGTQKREKLDDIQRKINAVYHKAYVTLNLGEW